MVTGGYSPIKGLIKKTKSQCSLDVTFVSIVTGGYNPIRGLIQEKVTIWIRFCFCFYGYWALVCQPVVFFINYGLLLLRNVD